jgi:hypothetical protein
MKELKRKLATGTNSGASARVDGYQTFNLVCVGSNPTGSTKA